MFMDYKALRQDLLELPPREFYVKHILKSHNWYFSQYLKIKDEDIIDKMDLFKEIVSSNLKISFHNVQIVGSAKVGYSLSSKKILRPFHDERPDVESSDIDIAVVSDKLYNHFWDMLRQQKEIYYSYNRFLYDIVTKSIFKGYIDEWTMLKIPVLGKEWRERVNPINISLQDTLFFMHPITYRLYRSWEDLEDYQIYSIFRANKTLRSERNV